MEIDVTAPGIQILNLSSQFQDSLSIEMSPMLPTTGEFPVILNERTLQGFRK